MSLINHFEAIRLENIVCKAYNCNRFGVGGMANADIFEKQPFLAAIISLSPVYMNQEENVEIEQFFTDYKPVFDYPGENLTDDVLKDYIKELSKLVKKYYT